MRMRALKLPFGWRVSFAIGRILVYARVYAASLLEAPFASASFLPRVPEDIWSEWQDLNLRPPRPERGALPDCATLRLPEGRPYNRVPPAPQAQVSAMTAPPATCV